MSRESLPAGRFRWWWVGGGFAGLAVLLVLLEGLFSFGHMISVTARNAAPVPPDHRHTEWHSRLGWVSEPGVSERDMYGPWRGLHTDGRGLRGDPDRPEQSPEAGRIVCVGGSAVFGVGVGDDETWCHRLGLEDADYATVNLGQPGYGAGQSFLHFETADQAVPDLVLFAVTDETLEQIASDTHRGFAKPRFDAGAGELSVRNSPVSRGSYLWPWATVNRGLLRTSDLFHWTLGESEAPTGEAAGQAGFLFFDHMLASIRAGLEKSGAQLALVYLPDRAAPGQPAGRWWPFLQNELRRRDLTHLDLAGQYKTMQPRFQNAMFYPNGHLTPFAHYWIAGQLAERLAETEILEEFDADGARPWLARYYRGNDFTGPVGREPLSLLSADWAFGAPLKGLEPHSFSAVFDSCLPLDQAEEIRLMLEADGRARLSVNDQTLLDTGDSEGIMHRVNAVTLPAGVNHLRVRYSQDGGAAAVRLVMEFEGDRARVPGPERLVAPQERSGRPVCPD